MNIEFSFIKGLALGLEYVDLDDADREELESNSGLMVILALGFLRVVIY